MTLDISSLQPSFSGDLITPSHPDYEAALHRWAKNTKKKAALVAYVKTHEDIAATLKFAKEQKIDLAVKGGGHSGSGASSSTGIVIDLARYFNSCKIADRGGDKVALIGGGATWETVDREAIKEEYATVGGTVNETGIAGLAS